MSKIDYETLYNYVYGLQYYEGLLCFGCVMSHIIQGVGVDHFCCGKCSMKRLGLCQPITSSWWGKLR